MIGAKDGENTASKMILVWCVLSLLGAAWTRFAAEEAASVAVLDFQMVRTTEGEDWAVGLADLLEIAHQDRGVTTCERREIRYVISEHKLNLSGRIRTGDVVREHLPWVRYLVRGSIEDLGNQRFALSVSMTDAQTGQSVRTFDQGGVYGQDLLPSVARAADQVVAWLGRGAGGGRGRKKMLRFRLFRIH